MAVLAILTQGPLPGCRKDASSRRGAGASSPAPATQGPALAARRVAVIGASLSAGPGAKPLAALLRRTLPPDAVVIDGADVFTYERPAAKTRAQIAKAKAGGAEVVIALDALFWFAYHNRTLAQKQAYLEEGLRLLAEVEVPLFVGDLPDMRGASPALIPPEHVPSPAGLAQLNARIRAWAKERPRVHVLPFSAWAKPLLGGGRIVAAPGQPEMKAADALHIDGLHPNGKGTLYILHRTLAAIRRAYPGTPRDHFRLPPALVRELVAL